MKRDVEHARGRGSSLSWVGSGETGFLLPVAPPLDRFGRPTRIRQVSDRRALESLSERLRGEVRQPLGEFFAHGGRSCRFLPVAADAGEKGEAWLGEHGAPGERTGLHSFRDCEAVGTVVIPAIDPSLVEVFLDFARSQPRRFLIVETVAAAPARREAPASTGAVTLPLANVIVLHGSLEDGSLEDGSLEDGSLEDGPLQPGPIRGRGGGAALAGRLAACDWQPGRSDPSSCASPAPFDRKTWLYLLAWRRWEGLRRSLDEGTRWVLFEPARGRLVRRLEREIRAFLHQLAVDGLLAPGGGDLDVRCELWSRDDAVRGEMDVRLSVRASLAGEYGTALTGIEPGATTMERIYDQTLSVVR